jgi:hypothetical protein
VPCVFCERSKTSKEHVFPQWLREVIPGEGRILHEWIAPPGSTSEDRSFTTDLLHFRAKVVCRKRCNGGWMHRLEESARPFLEPMVRGRTCTLYDEGREQVAYWALKTAMMIDCAQEPKHRSVPPADYPALYRAQGVLPSTLVWIGVCDFGAGATARHRTLHTVTDDTNVDGFGAVLHVGHLVIYVVRIEIQDGKVMEIGGQLASALCRLWPQDQPVTWPPPAALNRQQVVLLGDMIEASPITLI